ncbi:MAG TPA: nickel-binding protein, partial [Gammaproteobacteria bacterium]|nr:nickel-binding protein [Gammaproteobacteria bacterium]
MTELVLERRFDPPLTRQVVVEMAQQGAWCLEQYRVDWLGSLLAADGRSMVCRFSARDAESIRQALQTLDADMHRLWEATTHAVEGPAEASVLVERSFAEPVDLADLQAHENASQWCLDTYNVKF